jgi:hypothetical protein
VKFDGLNMKIDGIKDTTTALDKGLNGRITALDKGLGDTVTALDRLTASDKNLRDTITALDKTFNEKFVNIETTIIRSNRDYKLIRSMLFAILTAIIAASTIHIIFN